MFRKPIISYSTISLRADDIQKLREMKELKLIKSQSGFIHWLILKELQELKKRKIVKKRENLEDKTIRLTDDERLENYINNYNDYMESRGYSPIIDNNFEIMGWEK